jgi:geranylgeranyl pyrophosphate synthase
MSQLNGHGSGAHAQDGIALLDPQPDLHQALEAAIDISARRGTPLARVAEHAAGNVDDVPNPSGAGPKARNSPVPHPSELPPEVLDGVRQVDIMRALAPLAPRMKSVEREIERLITTPVKLVADIAGHVLGAGGKRLRPALTLLAAQICGDDGDSPAPRAVTCAALVELTHTTTLTSRRCRRRRHHASRSPAANLIWGNETSVLVGDYLFAQVFVAASRRGIAELMHPLAHATAQMCAGELLETQMRGFTEMSDKQYLEIVALKTGALTECACRMGALAVNADEMQVEALGTFGRSIGVAFQIVDDVFDVISTEEGIGKPVGNDLREGAITLPMLLTLKNSPDADEFRDILCLDEKSDADVIRAIEIMRAGQSTNSALLLRAITPNPPKRNSKFSLKAPRAICCATSPITCFRAKNKISPRRETNECSKLASYSSALNRAWFCAI